MNLNQVLWQELAGLPEPEMYYALALISSMKKKLPEPDWYGKIFQTPTPPQSVEVFGGEREVVESVENNRSKYPNLTKDNRFDIEKARINAGGVEK
jgi:hypothetical protein